MHPTRPANTARGAPAAAEALGPTGREEASDSLHTLPPIVFCNFSTTYGGQERWLEALAEELVNRHGVTADFLGGPERLRRRPAFRHAAGARSRFWPGQASAAPENVFADCGLVVLVGNRALYRNALSTILPGRPRVYVHHSMLSDGQAPRWRRAIRRGLLPRLLGGVDRVVRVSRRALPLEPAGTPIRTIYNGIDVERFQPRNRHGTPTLRALLMVGALTRNKNQELAIRTLAGLPGMRLVLAGTGPEESRLRRIAAQLDVADRVEFRGFVEDPAPLYAEADAFLLLSRHEGLPLVLLEAMASGLPAIATDTGGVAEVVRDGQDGLLLPPSPNVEDLAEAIGRLERQSALARTLGQGARSRIEERFTTARMVQEYWELFCSLDRRRPAQSPPSEVAA